MIAAILTYIAVFVAVLALALNFLAWRRKPRRKWLYVLGMLAAVWVIASYTAVLLGVDVYLLTEAGVLRWGAIMMSALVAAHAIVDT